MASNSDFPPRKPTVAIAIKAPKPFDAPPEQDTSMTFKPPEGFDTSGMQPGQTKQVVAEIEMTEDGMIKLKSVNGMPLGGEAADEGAPKDDFMSNAMPGGAGEGEGE